VESLVHLHPAAGEDGRRDRAPAEPAEGRLDAALHRDAERQAGGHDHIHERRRGQQAGRDRFHLVPQVRAAQRAEHALQAAAAASRLRDPELHRSRVPHPFLQSPEPRGDRAAGRQAGRHPAQPPGGAERQPARYRGLQHPARRMAGSESQSAAPPGPWRRKGNDLRRPLAGLLLAAALACLSNAHAQPRHGLSAFGDLKYPPDFRHFDYVNPDAPKGGELRMWQLNAFDNLNPLILKGVAAANLGLTFQSLMVRAFDEPDAVYASLAESAELGPDRAWVAFNIDRRARWHDGSPVTAEDVVFTFESIVQHGHPLYQLVLRDMESVTAESERRVVFRFRPTESRRDLPLTVATMPILSKAWFQGRDFASPLSEPPLGSGPYRIVRAEAGRTLVMRRVENWWAKDLPSNRGQYNFDQIRDDYYRDRDVAVEAFFAGEYDFREEIIARVWATQYQGKPAFDAGKIRREVLRDHTPSGVQAWFLNRSE